MKRFHLKAGTIVHLGGLPFVLVYDAVFEGHQANFDLVLNEVEPYPAFNLNPSPFQRIRQWWNRL